MNDPTWKRIKAKTAIGFFCVLFYLLAGTTCSCDQGQRNGQSSGASDNESVSWKKEENSKNGPPTLSDRAAWDRYVQEGWNSPFGLDYIFALQSKYRDPRISRIFGGFVGVRWVNFARVHWGEIEKRPPRGGKHTYDWSGLDEAVRQWQKYGVHILMSLRFRSRWATAPIKNDVFVYLKRVSKWLGKRTADYLPKPAYRKDFQDFIFNLVERYDGDGVQDMPGLLFPILHYQMGNEYCNELFWAGTVEEFGILLKEGALAARRANKDVKIVLPGGGFEKVYGFYGMEPVPLTQAYIDKELKKVPKGMNRFEKRADAFTRKMLTFCDDYDIVDARWPSYGVVAAHEQLLKQIGCKGKEVWSAEVYSFFPMPDHLRLPNWTVQPDPAPSKSMEYIRILKSRRNPKFDAVNSWYRGLQAAQVVKECLVALDAGSKKLMMGWALDVQSWWALNPLSYVGLLSATFENLWPAGYTYGLVIDKLDGFKSIRRLSMPENIYVYQCTVRDDKKVLVAFYDDHIGQNRNEPLGTIPAEIPFPGKHARLTHIITKIDEKEPVVEQVEVVDGRIGLTLSEYPIFLEPIP